MKTTQFQKEGTVRLHRINTWHFTAGPPNFPNYIKITSSFLRILQTSLNLHRPRVIGEGGVQSNKKPSGLQQTLSACGGSFNNSELTRSNRKVVLLMF